MATPPPEDPPDLQEEDHTHWQVVLSDPSSRKLVLYSPLLRRLAVHPTPPGSPRIAPGAARWTRSKAARGRSRGAGGGSGRDADGGRPPLSAPPRGPSRPGDSEAEGDDEEDEDDDDDEGGETPPAGTVGPPPSVCPLCLQDLPRGGPPPTDSSGRLGVGGSRHRARGARRAWLLPPPWADDLAADDGDFDEPPRWTPGRGSGSDSDEVRALSRAPARTLDGQSYFDLLSEVNSRATTPSSTGSGPGARALPHGQAQQGGLGTRASGAARLDEGQMNEGYFARFFDELQLLGKGGQGSVYLVRHVLNGEALGLYACKKIPVGDSTPSLLSILREVHLLESATHANITRYHHAWLETSPSRSAFAPPVPTLHILMEFANGGSLQGFVDARRGTSAPGADEGGRERARRARREGRQRAVHLLRVEDVVTLFRDVAEGLAFLHGRNILHLDLKAENVLLHWDDDALLPTCKLSDFGNATSDSYHVERRGGSGTLLYTPPEAFFPSPHTGQLPPPDRATDMWALGLVLYLLCYFALPYASAEGDDTQEMEDEVKRYGGFHPLAPFPPAASARHDIPPSLLALLQALINRTPTRRPLCDRVSRAIEDVRAELKRGWRPVEHAGQGEEVVLAAPRGGRWTAGHSFGGVPLWRPQRERGVGRLESVQPGDGRVEVEVEVEEPESRDDGEWRLSPPLQRRPDPWQRSSSPSLAPRSRSSSLPPLPPPERVPLPLPPPQTAPSARARTPPKQDVALRRGEGGLRDAVLAPVSLGSGSTETVGRVVAVLAAVVKLLLLSRHTAFSSLPSYTAVGSLGTTSAPPSVPLSLAALLVLETALDVALADTRSTVGIALFHVAALRWL